VLCPNPRGSYGQGEAFARGNVKDFGGGDYRDTRAGVEALSKQYPIDPKRLGIRGHSYGGYMTMWAETQTTRFAAAVAGAGLSNWLSYYGLNDIDEWMIPFFGASVYDDPAVYVVKTPLYAFTGNKLLGILRLRCHPLPRITTSLRMTIAGEPSRRTLLSPLC
jgi:prolyl oligopeptidase PreP (S9A serine peptidase family)